MSQLFIVFKAVNRLKIIMGGSSDSATVLFFPNSCLPGNLLVRQPPRVLDVDLRNAERVLKYNT